VDLEIAPACRGALYLFAQWRRRNLQARGKKKNLLALLRAHVEHMSLNRHCIYVYICEDTSSRRVPDAICRRVFFFFFFWPRSRMCVVIYYSSRCIYVSWYCCIYMCLVTAALELKASDSSSLRPRTLVASGLIH
jgi:hypothetical protein